MTAQPITAVSIITSHRRKFIEALKSGKHRQCFVRVINEEDGSYCAVGVAFLAAGLEVNINDYQAVRNYYDLTMEDTDEIWWMNDCKEMTFPEIGEALEKKWGIDIL